MLIGLVSAWLYVPVGSSMENTAPMTLSYAVQGVTLELMDPIKRRLDDSLQHLASPAAADKLKAWYRHAPFEIKQTLATLGYVNPMIRCHLKQGTQSWQALYQVTVGPPLIITELDLSITGDTTHSALIKRLRANLGLKKGEVLLSEVYEQAKQNLLNEAIAAGYLAAYFSEHQIWVHRAQSTAQIKLTLATGPRFYFGPVTFKQSILNDALLRRYVSFQTGEPYTSAPLLKLQDQLNASGYFKTFSVSELANHPDKHQQIPINLTLVPRPAQKYTVGLGYGTDMGPRASLGWQSRYLNSSGHKLSVLSQLAKLQSGLQTKYTIPGLHPATDTYELNFALLQKKLAQVASTTEQIGAASVSQYNGWQRSLFLNYQIERFRYLTTNRARESHLLTPGITLSHSEFDDPTFSLHGYRLSVRLQAASTALLSSSSFLQTELQAKKIVSWNRYSRLLLRASLGYTQTNDLTRFPPSLLFYAGGSQSIRGYRYQELGPGRLLMVASAEYQHQLIQNWYGTVFFDAGNAVNHFPIPINQGAGLGIVWVSPIGPLALTAAKAYNLTGRPIRLQFSMGIDLA